MIGQIIQPLVQQFQKHLGWYWFSRYDCTAQDDSGDCDISKIPADFMDQSTKHYRSVRFRYTIQAEKTSEFETACGKLITDKDCAFSDFLPYVPLGDLADDRHLEEPRTPERQSERAELVVQNYFSLAKICLHALKGPDQDGHFFLPHYQKQPGTPTPPFSVIHHILCNMTDLPLWVGLDQLRPFGPTNQNQSSSPNIYRVHF
jgi:hypothetical protein